MRDGTPLPEEGGLAFSTREGGALCPACAAGHGATQPPADARADLGALLDPGAALPRPRPASRRVASPPAGPLHPVPPGRGRRAAGAGVLAPAAVDGRMIVGTAGHIDHGKSALVEALTGRAMDRLAEERRRGITIDLNFAPLDLGGGTVVGRRGRPGSRGLRADHGGGRVRRGPRPARGRGRRRHHAADARAPRHSRASRRAARDPGRHEVRSGGPRLARAGRGRAERASGRLPRGIPASRVGVGSHG